MGLKRGKKPKNNVYAADIPTRDGGEDLEGKHGRIQYSAFFTDLRSAIGPATV